MIVEFKPEERRRLLPIPRRRFRQHGVTAVTLGSLLVALAVLDGLGVGSGDLAAAAASAGFAVLLAVPAALLLVGGLMILRAGRASGSSEVLPGLSYAFGVVDGRVIFPAFRVRPAENWPLAQTRITETKSLGFPVIRLEVPGRKARSFTLSSLQLSTAQILAGLPDQELNAGPAEPTGRPGQQPHPPQSGPTGPTGVLRVELAEWAKVIPQSAADLAERRPSALVIVGGFSLAAGLVLAVMFLAAALIGGVLDTTGTLVLLPLILALTVGGLIALRAGRRSYDQPGAGLVQGAGFAFDIAGGSISFPEGPGSPAGVWPLAQTEAACFEDGETGIELRCPGRASRRFGAGSLRPSPQTVLRQLAEHRDDLADHPGR